MGQVALPVHIGPRPKPKVGAPVDLRQVGGGRAGAQGAGVGGRGGKVLLPVDHPPFSPAAQLQHTQLADSSMGPTTPLFVPLSPRAFTRHVEAEGGGGVGPLQQHLRVLHQHLCSSGRRAVAIIQCNDRRATGFLGTGERHLYGCMPASARVQRRTGKGRQRKRVPALEAACRPQPAHCCSNLLPHPAQCCRRAPHPWKCWPCPPPNASASRCCAGWCGGRQAGWHSPPEALRRGSWMGTGGRACQLVSVQASHHMQALPNHARHQVATPTTHGCHQPCPPAQVLTRTRCRRVATFRARSWRAALQTRRTGRTSLAGVRGGGGDALSVQRWHYAGPYCRL